MIDGQPPLWHRSVALFTLGVLMTASAFAVLTLHARALTGKREQVLAIGTQLPLLRSRVSLLAASVETEKLKLTETAASREERAQVYVLPEGGIDQARTGRILRLIAQTMDERDFAISDMTFSSPQKSGEYLLTPLSLTARGTPAVMAQFVSILELGSAFTVRDVLPDDIAGEFLQEVETNHPSSLSSALEFLGLDLISYASDADAAEERFTRDMPLSAATEIRLSLLKAGLGNVRLALSGIATALRGQPGSWPLPFMQLSSLTEDKGQVVMEWMVYSRSKEQ